MPLLRSTLSSRALRPLGVLRRLLCATLLLSRRVLRRHLGSRRPAATEQLLDSLADFVARPLQALPGVLGGSAYELRAQLGQMPRRLDYAGEAAAECLGELPSQARGVVPCSSAPGAATCT